MKLIFLLKHIIKDEICNGNGNCHKKLNGTLECCCNRGFKGKNCQDIESCDLNSCKNGGSCLINKTNDQIYCTCKIG